MKITKTWAMPNGNTFTIKPIKELVEREVCGGGCLLTRSSPTRRIAKDRFNGITADGQMSFLIR